MTEAEKTLHLLDRRSSLFNKSQGPHYSPHSTVKTMIKTMIKALISGRMVSSGTRVVAFASVYSEKTRL